MVFGLQVQMVYSTGITAPCQNTSSISLLLINSARLISWFFDLKNRAMAAFSCSMPLTRRQPYCCSPLRLLLIGKLLIRLRVVVSHDTARASNSQLHAI